MLEVLAPLSAEAADAAGVTMASDAGLHVRYVECRRREARAAGEAAAVLGEIERRGSFIGEGYLSAVAFVAHQTGDSHQAAAGRVRVARTLGEPDR